jgi:RNA polymerase sigma-70 factor (ECF subfamily)
MLAMRQLDQTADPSMQGPKHTPDAEMIELVLLTLPPRLQTVLTLHHLEEMKISEIASVIGRSEGTVKSRLFKGRELMRRRLTQRGIFHGRP